MNLHKLMPCLLNPKYPKGLKFSYYAFWLFPFPLLCYISFFLHIIGLQSEKAQSPPQRDLPSPTENSVHQLLQTALL